jgi:hypothetical protein
MERSVAMRKLSKLLGKTLGYRVDPKAPTEEEREQARQQLAVLREARQRAEEALQERRRVLLEDQQYQDLLAAYRDARKQVDKTLSLTQQFRFTAGQANGMFFHVMAQGDSWEEVIAKLEKTKRT